MINQKTTTMSINYTTDCRHCGGHSDYQQYTNPRTMRHDDINALMHVDTECAIRCPVCRARLNNSVAEFHQQVTISLSE